MAAAMLSVGLLALAGSTGMTVRMVGSGQQATRVGQVAAARVERLRQIAFSTAPPCSAAEWRSDSTGAGALSESWEILDGAGPARRVMVVLRSGRTSGVGSDTIVTAVLCGTP